MLIITYTLMAILAITLLALGHARKAAVFLGLAYLLALKAS
jgi:hypothetical protein